MQLKVKEVRGGIMNKEAKIKVKKINDELNLRIKTLLASGSATDYKTAMRLRRVLADLQRADSMQYVNRIIENANLVLMK